MESPIFSLDIFLSQTRKGWWKNRILFLETYDWIQNNQTYQQEMFKSLDYFCLVFNWLDNDLATVQYLSSA